MDNINLVNSDTQSTFHYDAFISYRHLDPDSFAAEKLHRKLESFRLPSYVSKKHPELPKKINRVFRDEEELPLSSNLADPITQALINSDNLIVICTPKLKESKWCLQEIETFIKYHGRKHVFTALVEGEPEDSFPEILLRDEAGNHIEPLAADFRGKDHNEIAKKINSEVLRLIAPMYELNYDELKQRHREQRMHRIMTAGAFLLAGTTAFGIYFGITAYRIQKQADLITEQKNQIVDQALEIENQYKDSLLKYEISLSSISETLMKDGRYKDSLYTLLETIPSSKDANIPYSSNAEYALNNALQTYASGTNFCPVLNYENNSLINNFFVSPNSKYIVADTLNSINIFNTNTGRLIEEIPKYEENKINITFINDNEFIYSDTSHDCTSIYNLKEMSISKFDEFDSFSNNICSSNDYSLFAIYNDKTLNVFDSNTKKSVYTYYFNDLDSFIYPSYMIFSEDNKFLSLIYTDAKCYYLSTTNLSTGETYYSNIKDKSGNNIDLYISDLYINNDIIYICYSEGSIGDRQGKIDAYDANNNTLLWSNNLLNTGLKDIGFYTDEETNINYLFGHDKNTLYTINADNGEIAVLNTLTNNIVSIDNTKSDFVKFIVTDSNDLYLYQIFSGVSLSYYEFINNITNTNVLSKMTSEGLFVLHKNNSYITKYKLYKSDLLKNICTLNDEYYPLKSLDGKTVIKQEDSGNINILKAYDINNLESTKYEIETTASSYDFINNGKDGLLMSYSGEYDIYDVNNGELIKNIELDSIITHKNSLNNIVYSYDRDSSIMNLYNLLTDEACDFNIQDYNYDLLKLDISYDMKHISINEGDKLDIYDLDNNKLKKEFKLKNYISKLFFSDDSKYLIVTYVDNSIDIIDLNSYEVIYSIYDNINKNMDKMIYIPENDYYLLIGTDGYLFNENIEKIAFLKNCFGYDFKDKKLIFKDSYDLYASPILSYEETVQKAKENVGDYTSPDWIYLRYGITKDINFNIENKYYNEDDESSDTDEDIEEE